MTDRVKSSLEVCRNDRVKCFLAHFHQKIIPCDTGIVDQNIQTSVFLDNALYHFLTGIEISYAALIYSSLSAILLNGLHHFHGLFL